MSKLQRIINETIEIGRRYSHLTVKDIQMYFEEDTEEEKYLLNFMKHLYRLREEKAILSQSTKGLQAQLKEESSYLYDFPEVRETHNKFEDLLNLEISRNNESLEKITDIKYEYEKNLKKLQERFVKARNEIQNIDFNSDSQFNIYSKFSSRGLNDENIELSAEELILLFKGVAIGEVYLRKGFCHGYASVSATSRILDKLITIDIEKAEEAWEWASSFGLCHDYLPSPYSDYNVAKYSKDKYAVELASKRLADSIRRENEENRRRLEEEEKQRNRRIRNDILKDNDIRDRSLGRREFFIKELDSLSNQEKLIRLANDTEHSPKFYPGNIIYDTTIEDIKKLDIEYKKKLLHKFDMPFGKSPWKQFKIKLILATNDLNDIKEI